MSGIVPNYHSISDFRKQNSTRLKKLFKLFVSFLKDADLIAREILAIDGTKSSAHNSKKANFNQKKIDKHLAYIEEKTQHYLDELDKNDQKQNNTCIAQSPILSTTITLQRLKKRGYQSMLDLYIELNPSLCEPTST